MPATLPSPFSPPAAIPDCTSAEALARYIPGDSRRESAGPAWRDLRTRVLVQERDVPAFSVPAVAEPFLVWVRAGSALVEEREPEGNWHGCETRAGDLFLTAPGSAYDVRLRMTGAGPLVTLQVLLGLPLLARAGAEVFGSGGVVRLHNRSGFHDEFLAATMAMLETELDRGRAASALLVRSLAQALAVHLVRHYTAAAEAEVGTGGLSGHALRRVSERMARELPEPFSLARYAALAGISPWHFSRAFKRSTGLAPSRYMLNLRLEEARRLLRETGQSVIQVGLAVGYSNPSHFAQVFRREAGVAPLAYRRQA